MAPSPWFFTGLSVALTAGAHLLFKFYATHGGMWLLAGTIALFLMIPLSTFVALNDLTMAQVYLSTAAVPVLGLIAARFVLGEPVRRSHLSATAMIVTGIVLYQMSVLSQL